MKRFCTTLCLMAMLCFAVNSQAKDVYGFVVGNTTGQNIGMYKYSLDDTSSLQLLQGLTFQFWGGAYAEGTYYMFLSDDYNGNMSEGFCTFDFATSTPTFNYGQQGYYCSDMTYDYSNKVMYGVMCNSGSTKLQPRLVKIDLANGDRTEIAVLEDNIVAIAADLDGYLVGLSNGGRLYSINPSTGLLSFIGETDIVADDSEGQSLEFDRATEELYWSGLTPDGDAFIKKINRHDASTISTASFANNDLMLGLHIDYNDAPAAPENLTGTVVDGKLQLSFSAPTTTIGGSAITDIISYTITRDGTVIGSSNSASNGNEVVFTDDQYTEGSVYAVYATNSYGRGAVAFYGKTDGGGDDGGSSEKTALVPPYYIDFSQTDGADEWTVADNNNDGYTWTWSESDAAYKYPYCFISAADDDLVSPAFSLKSGTEYTVSYSLYAPGLYGLASERFQLSAVDKDGNETVIELLDGFTNSGYENRELTFTPSADGDYQFLLSALSNADQWQMYLRSFSISGGDGKAVAELNVETVTAEQLMYAGETYTFSLTVGNNGPVAAEGFTVNICDSEDGSPIASRQFTQTLAVGEKANVDIDWTATAVKQIFFSATTADQTAENVLAKDVIVAGEGESFITLGGTDSQPGVLPFAFNGYQYSRSQAIYRSDEIGGKAGKIIEVIYPYSNSSDAIANRPVQLMIANTAQQSVTEGWMADSDMTVGFNGDVDFVKGEGLMRLELDTPYDYTGNNLCLYAVKGLDNTMADVSFYAADNDEVRTAVYYSRRPEIVETDIQGSTMLNNVIIRFHEDVASGITFAASGNRLSFIGGKVVLPAGTTGQITVCDVSGKTLVNSEAANSADLSTLPSGVYIVRVNVNGTVTVRKFAVK
ncbi:MAG: T9SS type A sorting domain-containing protein [Prevotellaceae bacterium]|nr:T9SS type A sorting domain-containing protein [Prevotellaceae bacterium]